ncbi:hypothetical protein PPERSA_12336 [Pseudocohnilembus persalinus]|uniref:Thioesterase domain-containing protein n=1 Tax=Pseudocohnilembus persalinus TaxID=266149 RepID=A0A0V0R204_PSEPJ|nr:hypothetical protein PPERSA_12336 [Pseudocohnilembus persalinus]|eukprot:KRX08181.1 hypothetical protein PPERSA_12336 [Pseudocohnilembus persalinus]
MKAINNFPQIFDKFVNHPSFVGTFAGNMIKQFKLVENDSKLLHHPSQLLISYKVPKEICNFHQSVHGGAFATLLDISTTVAILRVDKGLRKSVTTDLSQSNLKPAFAGDELQILCDVSRIGKNLAFSECKMFVNYEPVLSGTHTKFMFADPWDPEFLKITQQN